MQWQNAKRSEDTEQIGVMEWARWQQAAHPELKWLHHCPNGGSRNKQEAVKLHQMGVKPGVSDLHLPYPKGRYHGLYIELKYDTGKVQPAQKEFLSDMAAAGYYACVCYSGIAATGILQEYISLGAFREDGLEMTEQNNCVIKS